MTTIGTSRPLRTAIAEHFAACATPQIGVAIIRACSPHDVLNEVLDRPVIAIDEADLERALSRLPLGRALLPQDWGKAPAVGDQRPPLTDKIATWLVRSEFDTATLLAGLFASVFCAGNPKELSRRIKGALAPLSFPFDYAGLVRASRLIAVANNARQVIPRDLAAAGLLLLPQAGWEAIRDECGTCSDPFAALMDAYAEWQRTLSDVALDGYQQLCTVALFARDQLVPLPLSGKLADVQPSGGVRVRWRTSMPLWFDPFAMALPRIGAHTVFTDVLVPLAQRAKLTLASTDRLTDPHTLLAVVGRSAASGGWHEVFSRAAAAVGVTTAGPVIEALFPPSAPSTAPVLAVPPVQRTYADILPVLRARVHGHDAVLRELALACDDRWASASGPTRGLIIGPPGSGKTTILSALAEATGRPFVRLDISQVTENGWAGLNVDAVAGMIYTAAGRDLGRAARAIVLCDEFDKLRTFRPLPNAQDTDSTAADPHGASVRAGRQEALLALFDTGHSQITFSPKDAPAALQLPTHDLIVIAAGAFRDLRVAGATPTDEELERGGLITELVARLGSRWVLPAPDAAGLEQIYLEGADGVPAAVAAAAALGYQLAIAPQAVRLVARTVATGRDGLTPRSGAALLATAARRVVLAALERQHPPEDLLTLGPDEVLPMLPPHDLSPVR
jgi:hypothetical protein